MSCITSDFVPADLDATRWENLEPLYQALIDRTLNCKNCLAALILDRSELDAAATATARPARGASRLSAANRARFSHATVISSEPQRFDAARRIDVTPHSAGSSPARRDSQ